MKEERRGRRSTHTSRASSALTPVIHVPVAGYHLQGSTQPSLPSIQPSSLDLPWPLSSPRAHLTEDMQQLGDELATKAGILGDDVGVVEDAAFLEHARLLQILIRGNCGQGRREKGEEREVGGLKRRRPDTRMKGNPSAPGIAKKLITRLHDKQAHIHKEAWYAEDPRS